jgi:menaquinone-specific isochorismate synthase
MAEPYGNYRDADGQPGGDYRGKHLVVRSTPIPDPGDHFLGRLPEPAALAWIRHGAGLAGWGEAARVTLSAGEDRFTAGEKWLREVLETCEVRDEVGRRGSGLVAFGSFTFDDCSEGSVLIVPRALLGRDNDGHAWLTTISSVGPGGRPPGDPPAWRAPAPHSPPAGGRPPGDPPPPASGASSAGWCRRSRSRRVHLRLPRGARPVVARHGHRRPRRVLRVRQLPGAFGVSAPGGRRCLA